MRRNLGVVELCTKTPDFFVAVKAIEDEKPILVFQVGVRPHVSLREMSAWL